MDIEHSLRAALRPEDPGPDFTAAVMARLDAGRQARQRRMRRQLPLALAASVLVAAVGLKLMGQQREAQRLQVAQQQLAVALEITSHQLNVVQQKLNPMESRENGI